MFEFSEKRLLELKSNFEGKKIAVVGDLMLDGYYWGDVSRISPEAPVPIVEVDKEFFRFGGAANVATNIEHLKGTAIPFGVIGNDNDSQIIRDLFKDQNINDSGIIEDTSRPTTVKLRVIADNQHVVRIDRESKENINESIEQKLIDKFTEYVKELDAVILQDYNKGVLTKKVITNIISIAQDHDIIISVDPKFNNFYNYKNVTVFKPNKKESEDILGIKLNDDRKITEAGIKLIEELNAEYLIITLGEKGISLFDRKHNEKRLATKARKVADVSGAGDTVISTLTMALAAGADITEAAYLANYAAGIVCEEIGIVPIDHDNLFDHILREID
jgi:rfaE bifunctional protein kinase chain/domain